MRAKYERFDMQVGVFSDADHKEPKEKDGPLEDNLSYYAGGPTRKKGRESSGKTLQEVSESFRRNVGINYLVEPFKKRTSDIIKFSNAFFKFASQDGKQGKRVENLLQAIVRNPILRGDYGPNSAVTKAIKGFDRYGIDTGQLFKNIKAFLKVGKSR